MLYGGLRHKCFNDSSASIRRNMSRWLHDCTVFNLSAPAELRKSGYRLAFSSSLEAVTKLVAQIKWDDICPFLGAAFGQSDEAGGDAVCMGPDHYFEYVLRWNMQFLFSHSGMPLFLYSHFTGHHHNSRTIEAMDVTVRDHILEVAQRNTDAIIILMGDHGVQTVLCDQAAPMLNVLAPRSLLRHQPKMAAALAANRDLVVSPWDIFATLHHIAFIGRREGQAYEENSDLHRRTSADAAARVWDVDGSPGIFSLPLANGITHIEAAPVMSHQTKFVLGIGRGFAPRSIFQAMPSNRGCRHAGIEKFHCKLRMRAQSVVVSCVHNKSTGGSKLPTGTIILVCEMLTTVAGVLLGNINGAVAFAGGADACQLFTYRSLHSWSISRGVWTMRIETNEGEPNAIFDVTFNFHADSFQVRDTSYAPVTRYKKYEWCTPEGVSPTMCVCGLGRKRDQE
eukprot:TRINITY_DN15474_c0_g1_i1.p1 TRINITY_DN15474_c0_g1~~TRINITY_DN15474_c0_g1_i1.p1  ORF type:complete len:466 (-),score=52.35 TRINITY_DN15474_c0_g1_i1:6-1361(-)